MPKHVNEFTLKIDEEDAILWSIHTYHRTSEMER